MSLVWRAVGHKWKYSCLINRYMWRYVAQEARSICYFLVPLSTRKKDSTMEYLSSAADSSHTYGLCVVIKWHRQGWLWEDCDIRNDRSFAHRDFSAEYEEVGRYQGLGYGTSIFISFPVIVMFAISTSLSWQPICFLLLSGTGMERSTLTSPARH